MRPIHPLKTGLAVLAGLTWTATLAQQSVSPGKLSSLRAAIAASSAGQISVKAITQTPVPDIYAVESDGEVFYIDATGRYSFVNASLIDMRERKDLTAALDEKINRIAFKDLPLEQGWRGQDIGAAPARRVGAARPRA